MVSSNFSVSKKACHSEDAKRPWESALQESTNFRKTP